MTGPGRRSKAASAALPSHDRWLLSYADFVTLLLAVFIVLFASMRHSHGSIRKISTAIQGGFDALGVGSVATPSAAADPGSGNAAGLARRQTSAGSAGELTQQLQDVLGEAIRRKEVVLQPTAEGLTLRFQDLGFFESGNAALLPSAAQDLKRTARVLARYHVEVRVEGHSDDQPISTALFHSNWELSTARAMSVLSVLVDQAGFPPDRVALMGYGPYRPIADNRTEEGRRQNRRVDLVVVTPPAPGSDRR